MNKKFKKTFLKELSKIQNSDRIKIEKIVFDLSINEIIKLIDKMKGYNIKYKIRVGDYRIGITLIKDNDELIFERVAHRKDIYRQFP